MSNNNNTDFSKEGASKGEGCGTGKNKREGINWQRREGCKTELYNEERGCKEEEKEIYETMMPPIPDLRSARLLI